MIDNARGAWKFASMQMMAAGVALQGAVLAFPDIKDWLGDKATHAVGIVLLLAGMGGRMVQQGKKDQNNG
jgi:hypothetical protein